MKAVLDTNVFRKLYDGDGGLIRTVEAFGKVIVSPVVLGELFHGYKNGTQEAKNLRWLAKFENSKEVEIVEVGEETAKTYARILTGLRKLGKPIPTNDIWIAAQAIELGAVLVTLDGHFKEIVGLRLWRPQK